MVVLVSIPMTLSVKRVAKRVTIQIVRLLDIVKSNMKQKQEHMILNYLPQNQELSTLHLEFNKAARTLKLTAESEASSNFKQAQLNYHEAYIIFKDFSNQRKEGICISNIAAMQMKSEEYSKAIQSYGIAIDKQRFQLEQDRISGLTDGTVSFVLATRYYLRGLAMY